ncbi:MAG: HAMP domain-containing histidine kinase, partial [Thiovulaceae bacterium]|nr:HAMP domain-containing histidine kinase [Sulfurimonadaceae bacterium]
RLIIQANQKFLDFYRCLDIDAFYKKHHRLLETFDKVENEEYIFNDGLEGIWIERVFLSPKKHFKVAIKGEHFSLKIQKIANDTSNQYLLTLSDITAMVKEKDDLVTVVDSASHTIKEQQEQLKKQAQKAAMGEMISVIAHQLKQPLSAISAMATNIKVKNGLDLLTLDFCLEINEKIIRDVHFMSTTIDDFRNFFRPDKESSLFSIHDNIQEVLQLLKPLLERHKITVNYQYDEDIQVRSFPTELKQVLMNIINNAKDVFLEVDNDKPQISIEVKKDDRYCSIVLSDNAGGIPDEILPNIFKPYFTTKGAEGTGLGLHMTKMIIEDSMKGSIEVANNEAGATFTIHIPLNVNVVLEIPEEVS